MAKLTTTYDSTLKEKIFVLKGEEAYARSTDCILEEVLHDGERRADWNTDIKAMKLEFHIDVLRDIGASYVTLYDNDDVIAVYDFDTNTHAIDLIYDEDTGIDNRIELNYDVEHHIYAKYMGNKQCLKSQSKSYMVSEPLPASYESSIEIEGDTLYNVDATAEFTVRLVGADYYSDQEIVIYDNNTRVGTVRTDVNGEATVTIENLVEGKHTLLARFVGTDHLSSAEESIDYSAGAILSIIDYPSYQINTEHMDLTVKLIDYCNNPLVGETVNIQEYLLANGQYGWLDEGTGVTDANGEAIIDTARANISLQVLINPNYFSGRFRARYDSMDLISDEVNITPYNNVTISLTQPTTFTGVNQSLTLTGQVSNVSEPVKVSLDNSIGTVTTDSNGNFTASYRGTGAGDVTVTASISNKSSSVTVEDVIQYWKAPSTFINRNYSLSNVSLSNLTNGFQLTRQGSRPTLILGEIPDSFELSYDLVSYEYSAEGGSGYHGFSAHNQDDSRYGIISFYRLQPNSNLKIVYNAGEITTYLNGVEYDSFSSVDWSGKRIGIFAGSDSYWTINNIKFKRLNND